MIVAGLRLLARFPDIVVHNCSVHTSDNVAKRLCRGPTPAQLSDSNALAAEDEAVYERGNPAVQGNIIAGVVNLMLNDV